MHDMISNLKNRIIHIVAWGIIPLAYLSWCFSTISYMNNVFLYFSGILGIVTATVYLIISKVAVEGDSSFESEIRKLNIVILLISLLFASIVHHEYLPEGRWMIYLAVVSWIVASVLELKDYFDKKLISGLMKWIKRHILLLVLLLIVTFLSLDSNMYQLKWDGLLYYIAVRDATLSSISSVALYGHIAMGAGAIYRFFASLLGDACNGMIVANLQIVTILIMVDGAKMNNCVLLKRF